MESASSGSDWEEEESVHGEDPPTTYISPVDNKTEKSSVAEIEELVKQACGRNITEMVTNGLYSNFMDLPSSYIYQWMGCINWLRKFRCSTTVELPADFDDPDMLTPVLENDFLLTAILANGGPDFEPDAHVVPESISVLRRASLEELRE